MSAERPFFIVGAPRSGTTLLRLMFDAHPAVRVPPESHFIPLLYHRFRGRFEREAVLEALLADERFREWELDADRVRRTVYEHGNDWRPFIESIYVLAAQEADADRWGDKTPAYAEHLPVLGRLFPEAVVFHLVRDPRDVAASLLEMPWARGDAIAQARLWRRRVVRAERDGHRWFGDRLVRLSYEALVAEPEVTLRGACRWVGLEFDASMLSYPDRAASAIPAHRQAWHGRTREPVSEAAVGRWKADLSASDAAAVSWVARREIRIFGYEPGPAAGPWLRFRSWWRGLTGRAT